MHQITLVYVPEQACLASQTWGEQFGYNFRISGKWNYIGWTRKTIYKSTIYYQHCLSCLTVFIQVKASVTRGWFFWNVSFHCCYQSFKSHERVPFRKCIQTCMFFLQATVSWTHFLIVWPSSLVSILVWRLCPLCQKQKNVNEYSMVPNNSAACLLIFKIFSLPTRLIWTYTLITVQQDSSDLGP